MSSTTIPEVDNASEFKRNLKEAIKTFFSQVIFIFFLFLMFWVLTIVFPENVTYEIEAFFFAYIMAVPFMAMISLYPFAK